jgi:hypothetical protein
LTTIGFLVVPLLFMHLPTPAMAGGMAAKLFAAQTWVSVVSGLLLLVLLKNDPNKPLDYASSAQAATIFIVSGVLLAFLSEFVVAPRIVARENLRFWHTAGSVMYFLQWVCAALTLAKLTRTGQRSGRPEDI